tara:strand:- start:21 stop:713 length:693 start_codon:yes stop_codon:yes gene_type:complete
MARINKYIQDTDVTGGDRLFGSDGTGATRNFSIVSITDFIKETNASGVPLQFNWKLNQTQTLQSGEAKITTSSGTTFANITSINVSKYQFKNSLDISTALTALNNKKIILIDVKDNNNYGTYSVGAWTDANSDGFYSASLSVSTSNGSFTDGDVYSIAAYNTDGDAHVAASFDTSGTATKTINHNLGKFPSVTIKLNDNSVVYADVSHTNNNTLTITFSDNVYTGVAYLN